MISDHPAAPCPGNDAALGQLLTAEAPKLAKAWRCSWDLDSGSVVLPPAVAASNPLLATMLALHKETCRLLYTSGTAGQQKMTQSVEPQTLCHPSSLFAR